MNSILIALIGYYSAIYGVNPKLALAVAVVESGLNPSLIGTANERGIFQLKPTSFPEYSLKELAKNELNIKLGVKYLAWVKDNCMFKENHLYVVCYNYGIGNAKRVKHPSKWPYYRKVIKQMKEYQG